MLCTHTIPGTAVSCAADAGHTQFHCGLRRVQGVPRSLPAATHMEVPVPQRLRKR